MHGGRKKKFKYLHQGEAIPKEVIKATREFRERLMADPYRPAYHFTLPDDVGAPGDPNGAFYHNGKYHLMTYIIEQVQDSHGDMYPVRIWYIGDTTRMHWCQAMGTRGFLGGH